MNTSPIDDTRQLRDAFACFPSGVAALCTLIDGLPAGMAVSAFTSVSLDPPLVALCVQNTSETWRRIRDARRFGISILGEGHPDICRQLAAKGADRFAGVSWVATSDDAVFLEGATVWFECSLFESMSAGDHEIALFSVIGLRVLSNVRPLVFHGSRFRQLSPDVA